MHAWRGTAKAFSSHWHTDTETDTDTLPSTAFGFELWNAASGALLVLVVIFLVNRTVLVILLPALLPVCLELIRRGSGRTSRHRGGVERGRNTTTTT